MLKVTEIEVRYSGIPVIHNVSLEVEHPELVQRNINYLMRKSIDGPKNLNDQDLEYVTKEFTNNFLFKDKSKRNFMEKTAEGSLKLLLKNYLSDL